MRFKKYLPLTIIVLIGIALRFYHNLDISLWHDEAFSALFMNYSWGEMLHRLGLDVHPPMYYIFLRFWHYIFGESLLSLRGFSIFFGSASIIAGWAFVKESFKNEKAALWAAVFIALNPFQLKYVTEARMYTFGAFFALLGAYYLVKALRAQKQYNEDQALHMPNLPQDIKLKKTYLWHYLGFALCMGIIILTHYYLLFTAAALCFYGLIYHIYHYRSNFRRYGLLLLSFMVIVISFLPWLKVFLFQLRQVTAGYWIEKMTVWSIPGALWAMLVGTDIDITQKLTRYGVVAVTLFSVYFLYRFLRKTQNFEKWLAFFALLAPFAGSLVYLAMAKMKGSTSSVFLVRYFLFASVFYTIAFAVFLREIKWKWLSSTLLVVYVGVNLWAFVTNWSNMNVSSRPGMAAASKMLAANVEPSHKVFVGTSFMFFNYKYYWTAVNKTPVRPLLYTGGRSDVSQISHVEGVAILENADFVPDFAKATKRGDTVWLIWTYAFGSNKPGVPGNWTELTTNEYPEVRPYVGASVYVTEYKVN